MGQVSQDALRELEVDAYTAVMRALYAGTYDLEKEELLTKLRGHLHIDNTLHAEVLSAVKEDLQALREGRDINRAGGRNRHTKSGPLVSEGSLAAPLVAARRPPPRQFGAPVGTKPRVGVSQRQRISRPAGSRALATDPYGYVGRRVWRRWPSEDPEWIEGFVYEFDAESGSHSILYDPNIPERETVEDGYSFAAAGESEYVLGDFVDLKLVSGSRRQSDRPFEDPHPSPLVAATIAANLAAAPVSRPTAPNKKRKPSAVAAVPTTAPFDTAWFAGRINVAGEEELGSMLQVLDRKELEKEAELRMLEEDLVNAGDAEKRAELDREFDALCEREEAIMKELAAVRAAEE